MGLDDMNEQDLKFDEFDFADFFTNGECVKTKSEPNLVLQCVKPKTFISALDSNERRNSLPINPKHSVSFSDINIHGTKNRRPTLIRSFKTSSKGIAIATAGDRRESSENDACLTRVKCNKHIHFYDKFFHKPRNSNFATKTAVGYYRVCIMGADAVGKRSLLKVFASSKNACANIFEVEEMDNILLSVVIDGEESVVEFVEFQQSWDASHPADAYIVVFSVHERHTYDIAIQYLQYLHNEMFCDRPVIIVANKVDLVRKRQVCNIEARQLANSFNCKYIETSATLNVKVDDLLVGILKEIKLKLNPNLRRGSDISPQINCFSRTRCFFNKIFHYKAKSRSLTDLT